LNLNKNKKAKKTNPILCSLDTKDRKSVKVKAWEKQTRKILRKSGIAIRIPYKIDFKAKKHF